MIPKQRFISAMNHKKPDDYISFMELGFHLYEEYVGKFPVVGYEYGKLTEKEKERAIYNNIEIQIETAEKAGHDVIRGYGGYWEISPGQPALLWYPTQEDEIAHIRALKKYAGDKYYILGSVGPTMGIPDGNQIMDFVADLYENPEEFKVRLEEKLLKAIEFQKRQLDAGADGMINCGDIAFNNGPFISPEKCDEFLFPYFNRWVESLKKEGAFSIWHTDGNIMPLMNRVLESGVTAIQCIDPLGNMDIIELKKQVGDRLTLIGNVNCSNLQLGTKESIDDEVQKIIQGCKGRGGFVLSACNVIFKGIPLENYQVMIDGRYKYGKEDRT